MKLIEKPCLSFVEEKCCNTTILDPKQFKSVCVGLTFHSFVGSTFTSFVGPTKFPQQKRESNSNTNSSVLNVGEPKNVGPNSFPPTKVLKVCCLPVYKSKKQAPDQVIREYISLSHDLHYGGRDLKLPSEILACCKRNI